MSNLNIGFIVVRLVIFRSETEQEYLCGLIDGNGVEEFTFFTENITVSIYPKIRNDSVFIHFSFFFIYYLTDAEVLSDYAIDPVHRPDPPEHVIQIQWNYC